MIVLAVLAVRYFAGQGGHEAVSPTAPPATHGGTTTGPTGSQSTSTQPTKPLPRRRILWGAWIGRQFTGTEAPWDMNAVSKFQRLVGKGLSVIHFSSPFVQCRDSRCGAVSFPVRAFDGVRRYGAIPFFSWGSSSSPIKAGEPNFTLRSLIRGAHDDYIRAWARAARAWGHPFFLQFDWEMNGRWYPWGEGTNGNRHGEFVPAWRHVHDVFTSVGATNVTWVWCPNVDPTGSFTPLYSLYPGDAYVDWTCLNGYNRNAPWLSFDGLYASTYDVVKRIAPNKPMIIGEIGSSEDGGSKAAWIDDLLRTQLPSRYPLIRGIVWFEKHAGRDYPIESSNSSRIAFARAIASPVYVSNVYASLRDRPIRPPKGPKAGT